MKNKIIFFIGVILAIVLLVSVVLFCRIGGAEITEGKYKITDCKDYPDAYIEVENGTIQFYNIDLNAIYQNDQLEIYNNLINSGYINSLSEEQLLKAKDLNNLLVTNSFDLDYDNTTEDNKAGTFTYTYFCMEQNHIFGILLKYDSFHKTIQVIDPVRTLVFEK